MKISFAPVLKQWTYVTAILLVLVLAVSCDKDLEEQETELLQSYLEVNNIEVSPQKSGLYYLESGFSGIESINAPNPESGDTVILSYKGYLLADTSVVFDEKSIEHALHYIYMQEEAIQGWEEGIGLMRKGVTAKLIIPSDLAYGKQQTGVIPPYSTLIIDLRIIDIRN